MLIKYIKIPQIQL